MPVAIGDDAPTFTLSDTKGTSVDLPKGKKVWICFLRYAQCIMCNLKAAQLAKRYAAYKSAGLEVLVVYAVDSAQIDSFVGQTVNGAFPLLADPEQKAFKMYDTTTSICGSAYGWGAPYHLCIACNLCPAMGEAAKLGLANCSPQHVCGPVAQMPADFLIGEDGKIVDMHYGSSLGDHMPWEKIDAFAGVVTAPSPQTML